MSYPAKPDFKSLARRCYGYGSLSCHCGGDLCVCGLDGEECLGCPDCEREEEDEEANRMPDCEQCGGEVTPSGFCPLCQY